MVLTLTGVDSTICPGTADWANSEFVHMAVIHNWPLQILVGIKMDIENTMDKMQRMGASKDVKRLINVLKDEEWDVREKAAEALGEIGDAMAVESLIEALKDENMGVQKDAKKA